jgi:hypothetical protein
VGINHTTYDPKKHTIISNASCTTNCLAPMAKVVNDAFGIVKGHMVTVHSYTNDQNILDLPHKDCRRARAAAENMIPTTTGAAKAIGLVLPKLAGKLDGSAIRVPTPNVSLTILTAVVASHHVEEVNAALEPPPTARSKGILGVSRGPSCPATSSATRYSIVDAAHHRRRGRPREVRAWYDNEWGFSHRMVDLVSSRSQRLKQAFLGPARPEVTAMLEGIRTIRDLDLARAKRLHPGGLQRPPRRQDRDRRHPRARGDPHPPSSRWRRERASSSPRTSVDPRAAPIPSTRWSPRR